jgi:hypothetical protein
MTSLRVESFTENEIIDPFKVIRYLENILPRRNVSTEIIVAVLKKLSRRIKGIRVEYKRVKTVKNCIAINGFYDHTRRSGIEIEVCCNSYKKRFDLDKKLHRALIYDIADTLCHESIHRYQYNSRDDDLEFYEQDGDEDQLYYSDPDEVFAFAANISHSLYRQFGANAVTELSSLTKVVVFDPYLGDYYTLFYQQPTFKKIAKMVYLNLVAIEQGKILHRPPN